MKGCCRRCTTAVNCRSRVTFRSLVRGRTFLITAGALLVAWLWAAAGAEDDAPVQPPVGNIYAPSLTTLVEKEVRGALRGRNIEQQFARFQAYASRKLDSTAGAFTGSEVTGNCRLKWYDHMLRNPLRAPIEAEEFTRLLHQGFLGGRPGVDRALAMIREKMDLAAAGAAPHATVTSPEEALRLLGDALTEAQVGHAKAFAPLTRSELGELTRSLYPVLVTQNKIGHTLQDRNTGRRLCDLLEKVDRNGLHDAASALTPLADPAVLAQLAGLAEEEGHSIEGATGNIAQLITTPAGTVVVGGRGANDYQLDRMTGVVAVIDLGGDDVYREGMVSFQRPLLVTIDLAGSDTYSGKNPGIQGSAILGVGMLVDAEGNDKYQGYDVAQASCLGGVGILIDNAGNDSYAGFRRVQSQAFGGLAILLDRAGHDRYHGALWTQGCAGPLGFAVLDDLAGNDQYYTGGHYYDDYEETPGYDGWGQGVGGGPRAVANGGIGVILDGEGDDVYEFDYLSHGGGYWCGLGFARDFGGNDQRLAATRKKFDGSQRTEPRFQRFGTGFGCHYALGFCFDDSGDDVYHGSIMGLGMGWDCSVGGLYDFGGKDRYESTGGLTQGAGAQASLGVLFDYEGDDFYRGYSQGNAPSNISYHSLPDCGGNFSFVIDYGGQDTYGSGARNDAYTQRGSAGGFIIDRPQRQPQPTAQQMPPADAAESPSVSTATASAD